MPLEIQCPHCRRKFRVPEKYAGKRVKCPQCEGTIGIPAAGGPPSEGTVSPQEAAPDQAGSGQPTAQRWYLQTEDGQQYGPVSREELNDWLAQGRIDSSCHLLCEGWDQWKWADEVFPQVAEAPAQPQQQAPAAVEDNSLTGIGEKARPGQEEVNPYVSPQEPSGRFDVGVESGDGGAITPRMRTALAQTRPWVLFLSILGFIGGGLMVLLGLVMVVAAALSGGGDPGAGIGTVEAVIFLVVSAICLASSYFLLRYGQQIGRFLRSSGTHELETALIAQKSFWKLIGILTLVFIALCAVLIVVLVVAGITVKLGVVPVEITRGG